MKLKLPKSRRGPSEAHNRAPQQERAAAKRIGGQVTKGSGSGYQKGDARRRGLFRVECKTTAKKSFSVTGKLIEKLEQAVFGADEIPVLEIELELGKHKVYVVPGWAMEDLMERLSHASE